jgi:hypothetical protein
VGYNIILEAVLEHLKDPMAVVQEIYRVLKHRGEAICISPFIFPCHGYPAHYCNFSKDGLEMLFNKFSRCSIEMNIGPTSAIANLISDYFALALSGNSKFMYTLFKGLSLLPIFYLKFFDCARASSLGIPDEYYGEHICG